MDQESPMEEFSPVQNQETNLLELDLTGKDLDHIPPTVLQCTEIEVLKLSFNKLRTLPEGISRLAKLKYLWLDFNQFEEFPEVVCELTSLEHLYLSQNKLRHVSPRIGQLHNLKVLFLHKNELTKLPNQIFHITSIVDLHISENQLTELSEDIGCLENLTMLRGWNNQIKCLPDSVCRLRKLKLIDFAMNQIQVLPDGFGTEMCGVEVSLYGNPLVQPPFEVCSQGMQAIADYQDQLGTAEDSVDPCLKMLIVGETCGGKTSLKNALVLNKSQLVDVLSRTHGIEITPWDTGDEIKINVYDFGGHEAYFLTHQLFLTNSALHLLVVDLSGYDESRFQVEIGRWLDMLAVRVPGAIVRIVGTHIDKMSLEEVEAKSSLISDQIATYQADRDATLQAIIEKLEHSMASPAERTNPCNMETSFHELNERLEKAKKTAYQKLRIAQTVIPVSSASGLDGIEALKDEIVAMACDSHYFPELRRKLPRSWVILEKLLSAKRTETNCPLYITLESCMKMGKSAGLLTQSSLINSLNYLHRTGAVLYYEALPGFVFLNPTRLIEIFKALLKDHAEMKAEYFKMSWLTAVGRQTIDDGFTHRAILPHKVVSTLLKEHTGQSKEGLELLLALMLNFGICHILPVPDENSPARAYSTPGRMYHFPWYLRRLKPTDLQWPTCPQEDEEHIELVCEMAMPSPWGLFERWSVLSTRHLIYRQAWENGMYAFSKTDMRVAIMMEHKEEGGASSLHVTGRGPRERLTAVWTTVKSIVRELHTLLKEWPGLYSEPFICCAHCVKTCTEKPGYFSGEVLYCSAPAGTQSLRCPTTGEMVDVNLVYPPSSPTDQPISNGCVQLVSQKLSRTKWRPLGRVLGLEEGDIEAIEVQHGGDLNEMKYQMLKCWERKAGQSGTMSTLILALRDTTVQENSIADELERNACPVKKPV
ncbi:malignant fibrous histiocytoma-amplified sequence 1 homolog [Branchiostoma lanceolatum]|uniref:malignant fibrous histiocytoma-amplified sequence 1 homolog n=1 Tax=Branchiostoma lanceolatum TaxID=7740 RepID=UPI003455A84C